MFIIDWKFINIYMYLVNRLHVLKFKESKRVEKEKYKYSPMKCNSASVCNSRGCSYATVSWLQRKKTK